MAATALQLITSMDQLPGPQRASVLVMYSTGRVAKHWNS